MASNQQQQQQQQQTMMMMANQQQQQPQQIQNQSQPIGVVGTQAQSQVIVLCDLVCGGCF